MAVAMVEEVLEEATAAVAMAVAAMAEVRAVEVVPTHIPARR